MAITIALVDSGRNRMRYLLTTDAAGTDTGTITTTGAVTPDILTDLGTNQGALMAIAKVITQGYGAFALGAQTQAKARGLYLSNRVGADPGATLATATCRLSPRTGVGATWIVDANVAAGNPTINLTSVAVGAGSSCYLDIYVGDTIGD